MAAAAAVSLIQPPPASLLTGAVFPAQLAAVSGMVVRMSEKDSRLASVLMVEAAGAGMGRSLPQFESAVSQCFSDPLGVFLVPPIPGAVTSAPETSRSRELRFRETHRELLRSFAGEWVCVDRDTLIEHGTDGLRVVERARKKGVRVPYVFRVPDDVADATPIGL